MQGAVIQCEVIDWPIFTISLRGLNDQLQLSFVTIDIRIVISQYRNALIEVDSQHCLQPVAVGYVLLC